MVRVRERDIKKMENDTMKTKTNANKTNAPKTNAKKARPPKHMRILATAMRQRKTLSRMNALTTVWAAAEVDGSDDLKLLQKAIERTLANLDDALGAFTRMVEDGWMPKKSAKVKASKPEIGIGAKVAVVEKYQAEYVAAFGDVVKALTVTKLVTIGGKAMAVTEVGMLPVARVAIVEASA